MGRERERRVYHRYAVDRIADNYKAINAAAQMDAPDSIRSFYKTLVALRKKMPVISAGKIEFLYPDNADLLAYRRYDGETELLVLCNLREREIAKPLPVAGPMPRNCWVTTRHRRPRCAPMSA